MSQKIKNVNIKNALWFILLILPIVFLICYVIINKENNTAISFETLMNNYLTWFNTNLNIGDIATNLMKILNNIGVQDNIYMQFVINYGLYYIVLLFLKVIIKVFEYVLTLGGKIE